MTSPTHVLSHRALQQGWNVFLWSSGSTRMTMGWRVDEDMPISIATMHRWFKIAMELATWKDRKDPEEFCICPVEVYETYFLSYLQSITGSALRADSLAHISPGDYAFYNPDLSSKEIALTRAEPFGRLTRAYQTHQPHFYDMTKLDPALESQVLQRDRGSCSLTGATVGNGDKLVVAWIVPPCMAAYMSRRELEFLESVKASDLAPYFVPGNALSVMEDMATLFTEGELGIDVDDNYRIVCFAKRVGFKRPLLTHLDPSVRQHLDDKFLRLHFRNCLSYSAADCDVREDYEDLAMPYDIQTVSEALVDENMDRTPEAWLEEDLSSKWDTPIGQELENWRLRCKSAMSRT